VTALSLTIVNPVELLCRLFKCTRDTVFVSPNNRVRKISAFTLGRERLRAGPTILDRRGTTTNLLGKHRSRPSLTNRPRHPAHMGGEGLITSAACFRRLRSLPFLCTSFDQDACHRPGPCSRFDLCTHVSVTDFERQPSFGGRRPDGWACSRHRYARPKTR
jgi:hypothetical protein